MGNPAWGLGERAAAWPGQQAREDAILGWDFPRAKCVPLPGGLATGKQAASGLTQSALRHGPRSTPGADVGDPASPREKIILVFKTSVQGLRNPSQGGRRRFSELEAPEAPATQSGRFLVPGFFGGTLCTCLFPARYSGPVVQALVRPDGPVLTAVSTWASRLEPRNRPAS